MKEGNVFKCGVGVGTIVVPNTYNGAVTMPFKVGKVVEMQVWKCGKTCFDVSVVVEYLDPNGAVCRTSSMGVDAFENFEPFHRVHADDYVHG